MAFRCCPEKALHGRSHHSDSQALRRRQPNNGRAGMQETCQLVLAAPSTPSSLEPTEYWHERSITQRVHGVAHTEVGQHRGRTRALAPGPCHATRHFSLGAPLGAERGDITAGCGVGRDRGRTIGHRQGRCTTSRAAAGACASGGLQEEGRGRGRGEREGAGTTMNADISRLMSRPWQAAVLTHPLLPPL